MRLRRYAPSKNRPGRVATCEFELALEVGTPQIIGCRPLRQRRAARAMARPTPALDQAVTVEDCMDGACGRDERSPMSPAAHPRQLTPEFLLSMAWKVF